MRLIDADALLVELMDRGIEGIQTDDLHEIQQAIEDAPTIERSLTFSVKDNKTGKEADEYNIALKEKWADSLCYCDMEGFALLQDGTLILADECGKHEYCPDGRFTVVWE